MIEIIPNWHPIFVHFTVALWSLAVVFNVAFPFLPEGNLRREWQCLARWMLRLGTGFGMITALAGWFAYNSVSHDELSHAAMTDHRNWALVTLGVFILLTGWSWWCERKRRPAGKIVLAGMVVGSILLAVTGWRGAEAVYRYGLGVMSLPAVEGAGHSHHHDGPMPRMGHEQMQGTFRTDTAKEDEHEEGNSTIYEHTH